jgi:hypothetical protein
MPQELRRRGGATAVRSDFLRMVQSLSASPCFGQENASDGQRVDGQSLDGAGVAGEGSGGVMEPENDAGELEAFVQAGRERSSKKMVATLMRSGVPESEAMQIAASVLESPQPYGF